MCHRGAMAAHEHRIYHQLQVTAHLLQKLADREVRDSGMTTAQLAVLAVVEAEGPVTQRAVADRLALNESAMTAMVRRLEDLGVIERVRTTHDRRERRLALTEEGRARLADAGRAFAAVNRRIDEALGVQGVGRLAGALERLRSELLRQPADG